MSISATTLGFNMNTGTKTPFSKMSREDLSKMIGHPVVKLSGKPFANGDSTAVVRDIIPHPYKPGALAFRVGISEKDVVDVGMTRPLSLGVDDASTSKARALRLAVQALDMIARDGPHNSHTGTAQATLSLIDELVNGVAVGDWRRVIKDIGE
jgi:hypothetical protein